MVSSSPSVATITELPRPPVAAPGPTIVRGVLYWGASGIEYRAFRGELLDISGRKVMDLVPGANDVSGLAPGVYFVRYWPSAVSRQPLAVGKVVIQR